MADHLLAGAPADAAAERERQKKQAQAQRSRDKRLEERLQAEADQAQKIKQQKEHKSVYMKAYRERKAAERAAGGSGAASGAASQKRANTWDERLEMGPGFDTGDPGRYTVSRTFVPRPPSPEPRHTGLQTIMDKPELLEMLLRHFTLEHGKRLLGPTCRQLAASVRDENVPWKALTEFEFDSEHRPDMETVHDLFAQAYPFYSRDALDPYAKWLLNELFGADVSLEDQWEIIFECIPNEGHMPLTDEGRTPAEVTDAYKRWLANVPRNWDVWDMKTLSDKIKRLCLEKVIPSCWQSWEAPPKWCIPVQITFMFWEGILGFKIDLDRIHPLSILGRLDEQSFRKVRKIISRKIRKKMFKNWNQFCFALLKECHNHYMIPEDEDVDDDYCDVRGDFERDEGADFEDPDFPE